MRPALALFKAFLKADLREAFPAALSGPIPISGAIAILLLTTFGAGCIAALLIILFRSVNPLVFDFYLLSIFALCVWLFPTGLISQQERSFMFFMRVAAPIRRRLEFLRVTATGFPLSTVLALPVVFANHIIGAGLADSLLLYILLATAGLGVMLMLEIINQFQVIRTGRWPAWALNLFLVVCFAYLISALTNSLSGTAPNAQTAFGPGNAMSSLYRLLNRTPAGIIFGGLAGAFLLLAAAATLGCIAGRRNDSEVGNLFAARQSTASRCVLGCDSRAGNRSWLGFVSSVLVLYILRARRLNAVLTIASAYAFWTALVAGSVADAALGPGVTTIVFSLSAFTYASIAFRQDEYSRIPSYLHGMRLQRLAFSTLVFSSVLSALIAAVHPGFQLLRGNPGFIVLRDLVWVLLAAYVSHLIMALVRPLLPLSEPIGTFAAIVIVVRCILVCQVVSVGSSYFLFRLPHPWRTEWSLVGLYAATAIPLTFAVIRTMDRRLRYLFPPEGMETGYPRRSGLAPDRRAGGDQ